MHWLRQVYLSLVPAYPIGYLIVNGYRGDQFWTKFYVNRSRFPANEYIIELVEDELDKISDIKNPKTLITLTDDLEPRTYGGFFLNPGAEIQLPVRLSFYDVEQARRMGANMEMDLGFSRNRRKVELNSEVGDELVSRMMLSDAAKRFIVQRQLQMANSGILFCTPIFGWFGIFSAGYIFMIGASQVAGPVVGFVLSVALSFAIFQQFVQGFHQYKTSKADELVIKKDVAYAQGARDYFTAAMKFNRLARHVLGEENIITKQGDILTDKPTYSDRLKSIENLVKSLNFQ